MAEVPPPTGRRNSADDANAGWAVLSTLLAGIVVWGGIGWLIDRWLHTWVGIVTGMLVGFASSIYLIVKKYGN